MRKLQEPLTAPRPVSKLAVMNINEAEEEVDRLRAQVVSMDERIAHQTGASQRAAFLLQAARDEREEALTELKRAKDMASDLRMTLAERDRLTAVAVAEFGRDLDKALIMLGEIAVVLGLAADPEPDLVTAVEELIEWMPEYTLDDGTGDAANVMERAEYASADIKRLRRVEAELAERTKALATLREAADKYPYRGGAAYLTAVVAATDADLAGQVRGEVLREAADVCFALMGPVSDKRTLAMQEAAHEIVQLAKEAEKAR